MAQAMICDGGCNNLATVLITNISSGDVLAFDVVCSALWAQTHADGIRELCRAEGIDVPGLTDRDDLGAADTQPQQLDTPPVTTEGETMDTEPTGAVATKPKGARNGTVRTRGNGAQGTHRSGTEGTRADRGPDPDDPGF